MILPLALRLLRARVLNFVPTACVALAVAVFAAVLGVFSGYLATMERVFREFEGDLVVSGGSRPLDFSRDLALLRRLPGVRAAAPESLVFGIAQPENPKGGLAFFAAKGIDRDREAEFGALGRFLERAGEKPAEVEERIGKIPEGRWILLGEGLARSLGAQRGSRVRLYTRTGNPRSDSASRDFYVAGLAASGYGDFDDAFAFIPDEGARKLMPGARPVEAVRLRLEEGADAEAARPRIQAALPGLAVRTWRDEEENLFEAIEGQQFVWNLVLLGFLVIASFLVLFVLLVRVREQRRGIGVLLSVGGSRRAVAGIFILQGAFHGLAGGAAGLAAGLLFLRNVEGVRRLLESVLRCEVFAKETYRFDRIPVLATPAPFVAIGLAAAALGILASVLPALRAARMEPVRALREDG